MGQMTIRQIDDAVVERLRAKAKRERISVEALARRALDREAAALTGEERVALSLRMQALAKSMTVPGVRQTPAEELIRESRDFDH